MQIAAHAADLAVQALMQGHLEQGAALPRRGAGVAGNTGQIMNLPRQDADFHGRELLALGKRHSLAHDLKGAVGHPAPDEHMIHARHVMPGMHHPVGQFTVVGEQDKPFRKKVETPGGIKAAGLPLRGDEIEHRGPAFGIVGRGHHAHGFVQQQVAGGLRDGLDGLAVHFQLVGAGRDLEARRGDGLAVDADASGGDELVGPAAGTDAGVRQRFVDSYGLFHDTPGRACAGPFPAGILRWRLPIMWARMPFRQGICE